MEVSKKSVRRLMIEKQGLSALPNRVTKDEVFNTIDRLGCVQIDTINVVERSHYLTLWSRLGCYDKEHLHELAYKDRKLFEYWAHAASYVPLRDYRYFINPMKTRRMKMRENFVKRTKRDPKMLDDVLERVRKEGPLGTKDFEHKGESQAGGWWNWKPAKRALEALFGSGILLISHRENFQRHYDLAERVLPAWVDSSEPAEEERMRFYILHTMASLGLVKPPDIRWYYLPWSASYRRTSKQLQSALDGLVEEDEAIKLDVEDEKHPYYCLPEDSQRIQRLVDDFGFDDIRFLTNFDNLLWDRERVKTLFGFEAKLETYIPKEQRKYGYFNLPMLYGDRLVGRIVPKMDRGRHTLIIRSVWHEPCFKPDEAFEDAFAESLDSFAKFNGAENIEMMEETPRKG